MAFKDDLNEDYALWEADWGKTLNYTAVASYSHNPTTGMDSGTPTSYTVIGLEVTRQQLLEAVGEGTVEVGDVGVLVRRDAAPDGLPVEPQKQDAVTMDSDSWRVQGWKNQPDDNGYIIHLRKVA